MSAVLAGGSASAPAPVDRIDAVDGLRAVAMTMVIAGHCFVLPIGWMGVWLFYTISGFVIMRGFVQRPVAEQGLAGSYAAFLARRFWRIVPVYLLYILVAGTVGAGHSDAVAAQQPLPYLLSFTYNWHLMASDRPGSDLWFPYLHLWSLSVEQQFYLVFPLLVLGLAPRLQGRALLTLAAFAVVARCIASAVLAVVDGTPQWKSFAVYLATPCHFDAFAAGALIAHGLATSSRGVLSRRTTRLGVAAALAGVAYCTVYFAIGVQRSGLRIEALHGVLWGHLFGQGREVVLYGVITLASAYGLSVALCSPVVGRLLGHRCLRWVGRISYGGYLFHALVLWALAGAFGAEPQALNRLPVADRLLLFAGVMGLTVPLAALSFRYFEEPIRLALTRSSPRARA